MKKYAQPNASIYYFQAEDVIRTSGTVGGSTAAFTGEEQAPSAVSFE